MSNFQKNNKDYGEPDITYQLAGAAEQRQPRRHEPRVSDVTPEMLLNPWTFVQTFTSADTFSVLSGAFSWDFL